VRAQSYKADLAGKAHIRASVTERDDLVIESRRPEVSIVDETRRDVVAVIRERIRTRRSAHTWSPFSRQIRAHRLAVAT
jgi:hypothetical protein